MKCGPVFERFMFLGNDTVKRGMITQEICSLRTAGKDLLLRTVFARFVSAACSF
jgi:hypothetical protein